MQIISLISNDRFLSNLNVSVSTENMISRLNDFFSLLRYEPIEPDLNALSPIFLNGNWSNRYEANWTETLHKTGFCYTFNFPNSSQFFHLDEISPDFDYNHTLRMRDKFEKLQKNETLEYPVKVVVNEHSLYCSFTERPTFFGSGNSVKTGQNYVFNDTRPVDARSGYSLYFHDPFEVLSDHSTHLMTTRHENIEFQIFPEISNYDESLTAFTPEE
jgi:hypothetical protein